eukprot:CAMPEP_0170186954 /NCGR_PEP_ID=MMETSP0040_2-20121228/40564_1 /TAXON_ID=641309 /ORGANISM="Lotharella oceanica, Strain CCMP622" /LENGTH=34 /DNA_ID= /DNA_START= /DNA_END= /DNA_ORIENTATION=
MELKPRRESNDGDLGRLASHMTRIATIIDGMAKT